MNLEKIPEWVNLHSRRILLAGLGLVLVGAGIFWDKTDRLNNNTEGVKILSSETVMSEMVVDIEGAIARPGVYRVKTDNRINDVIDLAGGFSEEVDTQWVETNLNRSAKVTDGMKIYIPRKDEDNNAQSSVLSTQDTKININTAGVGELDKLPGVGEVTAGKIISGRPYARAEELLDRKVVSQKVWDQIKDLVSTW